MATELIAVDGFDRRERVGDRQYLLASCVSLSASRTRTRGSNDVTRRSMVQMPNLGFVAFGGGPNLLPG
jgi:hypothetical protein